VLVTLVEVAGVTSRDAVLPRGLTAFADGDHVIDCQILVIETVTAVLALI
jgi:hypothetical protein